jgi:hypothetical protein
VNSHLPLLQNSKDLFEEFGLVRFLERQIPVVQTPQRRTYANEVGIWTQLEVSPRSAYRDKSLAYFGQGKWPSGLSNEPCNGLPDLHACSLRVRRGRLAPHHAPEALQLTAALKRNIHNVFIGDRCMARSSIDKYAQYLGTVPLTPRSAFRNQIHRLVPERFHPRCVEREMFVYPINAPTKEHANCSRGIVGTPYIERPLCTSRSQLGNLGKVQRSIGFLKHRLHYGIGSPTI